MKEEYTVGTWAESWFTRETGKRRASTEESYRNLIYRYIVPSVGRIRLKVKRNIFNKHTKTSEIN